MFVEDLRTTNIIGDVNFVCWNFNKKRVELLLKPLNLDQTIKPKVLPK
ncbi:hypothetical protein A2U01_0067372, partial [Trifolium medium]|nr:hypothetical protein [Trifolium medium]